MKSGARQWETKGWIKNKNSDSKNRYSFASVSMGCKSIRNPIRNSIVSTCSQASYPATSILLFLNKRNFIDRFWFKKIHQIPHKKAMNWSPLIISVHPITRHHLSHYSYSVEENFLFGLSVWIGPQGGTGSWFSGRRLRTVCPACQISLSRSSLNSSSRFSR